MTIAYVDSSVLVALNLGQPQAAGILQRFNRVDRVCASNLAEAELRSACHREGRTVIEEFLADFEWVKPSRSLGSEISRVLDAGYLRAADCWHLACALYVARKDDQMLFLTLDLKQRAVAKALGFAT